MSGVRLVIFGRQGAGKGTQCLHLSERYGVPHVSTGDMLRAAAEAGTPFGLKAKEIMEAGELVPDDVMYGLVEERLAQPDAEAGVLLDGFPRTAEQAAALDRILGDDPLLAAINLEVPEGIVIERMLARGREDDTEEAIRRRLDLYLDQTAPLLAHYDGLGLLVEVDGVGTEDEVAQRLAAAVEARRS
ncbi:MAG: adenylate kinase [Actinomycetota bacterium]